MPLLLAWAAPTALAEWRLRAAWGFGPDTIVEAAGVPAAGIGCGQATPAPAKSAPPHA